MTLPAYTSQAVSVASNVLNGGLNSTAGPLGLKDNESSDLRNIDFNKFGSIFPRNGYIQLNTVTNGAGTQWDGLHWYEYNSGSTEVRKAIGVGNSKIVKMDDLDGTWDDITGGLTVTDTNHWTFSNFLNTVYATNGFDAPWEWDGGAAAIASTLPANVTVPKYNELFNNFLFYAHVKLSGVVHNSRVYWSNLKDTGTWAAAHFIDVAKDDGQEITGIKVLSDRLVVYKSRSIYNLLYTGDTDVPFVLPGGGKSTSSVGCVSSHSIQNVNNGHVFLSHDGFYFYDGNNSYKISDKITNTLLGYNTIRFDQSVSLVQRDKNRYMCTMVTSGQATNDRVAVWDYFNNAWSIYVGINASAMATFYTNGDEEKIYFGDYEGYVYRMDLGVKDNPEGVSTAIDAYYWTNWRHYGDLINKKGIPEVTIYYQNSNSILTLAYSYDFETGEQFVQTFSLAGTSDVYGSGLYGTAVYGSSGGAVRRRDLTGRGRVIRVKYANNVLNETFQIDGMGTLAHLETNT